ncbi:MAG: glycogen debranching protein [Cyanobacteria bacterium P01_A01_bin.135]
MTIWVNEQIDPCGLVQACIASCDRQQAETCHQEFVAKLTDRQRQEGWRAQLREVDSWDDVPVTALKLSY